MASETNFTGKSVDEAIAEGLRTLGLTAEEAEIEIISRGSRGIFGLGSEPAQVRITPRRQPPVKSTPPPAAPRPPAEPKPAETVPPAPKPAASAAAPDAPLSPSAVPATPAPEVERTPPARRTTAAGQVAEATDAGDTDGAGDRDAAESTPEEEAALSQLASQLLSQMVELMGFEAEVIATWSGPDADNDHRYLLLDLQGQDLSPLIGRRGDTLSNMQYLLRLMVNQRLHQWKNIVVDVEGYRQRRIDHLSQLALRSAQQVAQTGRALSLEPMPANERRIVHLTLRDHAEVYTESSGEGGRRKVQILPRR